MSIKTHHSNCNVSADTLD